MSERSMAQLAEEFRSSMEDWQKTKTIGSARFDPDLNIILIKTFEDVSYEYEVRVDECRTAYQLLDWIYQLNEKSWCDGQKLKDFLDCVELALADQNVNVRLLPCKHELKS